MRIRLSWFLPASLTAILLLVAGCSKDSSINGPPTSGSGAGQQAPLNKIDGLKGIRGFSQVNLTADLGSLGAKRTDPNLQNAWGISEGPSGALWISANHSSLSVVYDQQGHTMRSPVNIPTTGSATGGAPSGNVFNGTSDFVIPGTGSPARFIFAGEDGIISAWNSGSNAMAVIDSSTTNAVFKGIEIASSGGKNYIYATNFRNGTVDVFDKDFNFVSNQWFKDPNVPSDYGPFNIRLIGGNLFVTWAEHKPPDNMDDLKGVGHGFVDVYATDGTLLMRFASAGTLNSPWGIVQVHGLEKMNGDILIGNFGDGFVNVFSSSGSFLGQLKTKKGALVSIDGLWGLTQLKGEDQPEGRVYFTAGPNDENDGLFGYLHMND